MVFLNPTDKSNSAPESPSQATQLITIIKGKQIPRLYQALLTHIVSELRDLPISERITRIRAHKLNPNLEREIHQDIIEDKFNKAKTHDEILAIFKEIKSLCTTNAEEQTDYSPETFSHTFKPVMEKIEYNSTKYLPFKNLLPTLTAYSEDKAISEMLHLWNDANITTQEDFMLLLRNLTYTTKISISDCYRIGVDGATAFADALTENTSILLLHIFGNKIGDAGATALAPALTENTSLKRLVLTYNQIGADGAAALAAALTANASLEFLNLWDNQIKDAGAASFAAVLKENKSLTGLGLGSNQIKDTGAAAIAAALEENESLTFLDLSKNQIGDAGASALAAALKENTSLMSLVLTSNQIGDAGVAALAAALKENTSLMTLYLVGNKIGHAGLEVLEEIRALYPTRQIIVI